MATDKIIRTICYFTRNPSEKTLRELDRLGLIFTRAGFEVQTKRVCSPDVRKILAMDRQYANESYLFGLGSLDRQKILDILPRLGKSINTSFSYDLTLQEISLADADVLFRIIKKIPSKTFSFAYTFNVPSSSPFFPSGEYGKEGFAIGLQPTDLAEGCRTLEQWLGKMRSTWDEIIRLMRNERRFLGIDSSVAPLFEGKSSLVWFINRLGLDFSRSSTTDIYLRITRFIRSQNPKPVGLCGLMFPCLEDFELAKEYEKGNFSIERNMFLSLHSGLGIDTYPIGIDEDPKRVIEILKTIQGLSNKYKKPLSARFVSDGKARIGHKTDFRNQYLKDVIVRKL